MRTSKVTPFAMSRAEGSKRDERGGGVGGGGARVGVGWGVRGVPWENSSPECRSNKEPQFLSATHSDPPAATRCSVRKLLTPVSVPKDVE